MPAFILSLYWELSETSFPKMSGHTIYVQVGCFQISILEILLILCRSMTSPYSPASSSLELQLMHLGEQVYFHSGAFSTAYEADNKLIVDRHIHKPSARAINFLSFLNRTLIPSFPIYIYGLYGEVFC